MRIFRPRRRARSPARRWAMRALAIAGVVAEIVVLVRAGRRVLAAETVVRCRDGHLFTTLWIPGASLKAVRLGPWRFQRCPVGRHWTMVTPVRLDELTDEERRDAAEHRDRRIP